MSLFTLNLVLISVTLSAIAQLLFKSGVNANKFSHAAGMFERITTFIVTPEIIAGFALYVVGALLWLNVLSRLEVSQAYPFVGVGFVLTAIFGVIFFGDHVTIMRVCGMLVVTVGIYLVARG